MKSKPYVYITGDSFFSDYQIKTIEKATGKDLDVVCIDCFKPVEFVDYIKPNNIYFFDNIMVADALHDMLDDVCKFVKKVGDVDSSVNPIFVADAKHEEYADSIKRTISHFYKNRNGNNVEKYINGVFKNYVAGEIILPNDRIYNSELENKILYTINSLKR
jgi:hypothetical protein